MQIVHLFRKYDIDGSSLIDMDEFKNMLSELGLHCTPEEVQEIFTMADEDCSGQIDWNEFLKMMVRAKVMVK